MTKDTNDLGILLDKHKEPNQFDCVLILIILVYPKIISTDVDVDSSIRPLREQHSATVAKSLTNNRKFIEPNRDPHIVCGCLDERPINTDTIRRTEEQTMC